jgi:hypothetical protein
MSKVPGGFKSCGVSKKVLKNNRQKFHLIRVSINPK